MRIKMGSGLLPLNLVAVLLVVVVAFSLSDVLRIILGLPFVLFFPGYALVLALFPKREGIGGVERVALSLGLSIAVVPLIGLILNYTPWGIALESVLYSIASFTLTVSVIGWVRRKRLPGQERFDTEFQLRLPGLGGSVWDKILSIALVITILGALAMLGYVIATPKVGERFSEFYILGAGGKAADYPKELVVGEEGRVIVGIINHEHETMSYRVEVLVNGVRENEVGPVVLRHEEKWEVEVSFTPGVPGHSQKVEFLLCKNGEVDPSLEPLHLWIDVTE